MSFETVADLSCDVTIQLGGINKETGKPNPKSIEGYWLGYKIVDGKYGPAQLHVFQTKTGNTGVWGKTDLDAKLSLVKPGTMVRATFDKTVPSNKGNDKWVFKVEFDKGNRIEVAAQTTDDADVTIPGDFTDEGAPEESSLDSNDDEDTQVEEPPVQQPRRPSSPAKPNAAKAQALLSGRRAS